MDWRVKGVLQKVLSCVPGGTHINSALQLRMGGLKQFDRTVDAKVHSDWLVHVAHMQELGVAIEGKVLLEIGSGWYPTLPVCFHLAGAARCQTYDLKRLMDWTLTRRMLARLSGHVPRIAAQLGKAETLIRGRLEYLQQAPTLDEMLARAGIDYHAPADATRTDAADASIDVVFSNSVLEHVPGPVIAAMMRETRRILARDGIAIHSVNCGDHYAYFDRSITQINYLRYSNAEWCIWNNDLQYQNRLRANDFLAIACDAGLSVVLERQRPRPELLSSLDNFPVASEFRHYSREQLCTTSVDFVVRTGA